MKSNWDRKDIRLHNSFLDILQSAEDAFKSAEDGFQIIVDPYQSFVNGIKITAL